MSFEEKQAQTPEDVLNKLKSVPDMDKVREKLPSKEEIQRKLDEQVKAEVKKLSQILSERKDKQVLQKAYLSTFKCNVEYGDPTLSEFMNITRDARESGDMDNFIFNLIVAMLKKADPEISRELLEGVDGAEALEILQVMVSSSPFFKKLFELQKEGTLLIR